ncbi:hypothetical protein T4D_15434 [Trichinella pseudospiralis]|uniref:Uncharacterized protein n=1 Tax=Trichinella pseudospiralis TaxID=6337 RepID=A0A0V1FDD4_TRIPS|nr:hypothetical protein T4D_15434 [Trichinella pseudospiralis]
MPASAKSSVTRLKRSCGEAKKRKQMDKQIYGEQDREKGPLAGNNPRLESNKQYSNYGCNGRQC